MIAVADDLSLVPTMTAFENLELPMMVAGMAERECRDRAHALLDIVGLADKGGHLQKPWRICA